MRIHATRARAEPRLVLAVVVLLAGLLLDLHRVLQRRLIRRREQTAAVGAGIVNKLPLIVVVFLVELANRFILAGAGHSHDR